MKFPFSRLFCDTTSIITLLGMVILFAGCGVSDPKDPRFVVARGKGITITRSDLDSAEKEYLSQNGMQLSQVPQASLQAFEKQILEQKVTQTLLLNLGKGLTIPDLESKISERLKQIKGQFKDEKEFMEKIASMGASEESIRSNIHDQYIINEVFNSKVEKPKEPTQEEVSDFYSKNPTYFQEPKEVKASHILIRIDPQATPEEKASKKKEAEKARTRIVSKKEDFAKVAKEVSQDPGSAVNGGSLGFFSQGKMVPEFDKMAFSTKPKEVSPVFETTYGYHFLKVEEVKPERTVPLEEASANIIKFLKQKVQKESMEAFLTKLKGEAEIKYFLPELTAEEKPNMVNPEASVPK